MEVLISLKNVILLFWFSPGINFILLFELINRADSSVILLFLLIAKLYISLNLKAWGVCVKKELSLFRLNIWFLILYLIESLGVTTGMTALFFFKLLFIFFNNWTEKFGLAASWINTFFGLNFFKYFNAINDESNLSLPPLITSMEFV